MAAEFGLLKCIGTKLKASANNGSRSNGFSTDMKRRKANPEFVLCVRNKGCDDLQVRKAYLAIPDPVAAAEGFVRVLDESGEDYLYPAKCFVPIDLPASIAKALDVPA
jgi:hypothetical protein